MFSRLFVLSSNSVVPTCLLCGENPEDREHLASRRSFSKLVITCKMQERNREQKMADGLSIVFKI